MPYIPIDLPDLADVDGTITPDAGRILVGDGTHWNVLAPGAEETVLAIASGVPAWVEGAGGGGGGASLGGGLVLLDEVELAADGSITFDSIPSGYHALRVVGIVRGDVAGLTDSLLVRFGAGTPDTGTNYRTQTRTHYAATSVAGSTAASGTSMLWDNVIAGNTADAGQWTYVEFEVEGYDVTGRPRYALGRCWQFGDDGTASTARFGQVGASWGNTTDAVDVIEVDATGALKAGSTLRLYGVKGSDGTNPVRSELLHVREEQAPGTNGDDLTPSTWVTRTLNTIVTNEVSGSSLASNVVTLPAGTYRVAIRVPAYRTNEHTARLYDVTNSAVLLSGSAERSHANAIAHTNSWIVGQFTLSAATDVRVDHIVREENTAGDGGGHIADFGQDVTVYTEALFERIAGGGLTVPALLHVRDEKAAGTDGGTFTSGAWRTRDLNTVKTNEVSGASLATNQITLPAGTYEIEWAAPGGQCGFHQSRLRDITNGATLVAGRSAYTMTSAHVQVDSLGVGRITLAAETVVEIQHRCSNSKTSTGFGAAANFGEVEVYAEVMIRRIA